MRCFLFVYGKMDSEEWVGGMLKGDAVEKIVMMAFTVLCYRQCVWENIYSIIIYALYE